MVLKRKIQDSAGDRVLMAMIYLCLIVILLAVLYPLLWVVSASFSDPFQIRQGKLWLMPVGFQLEGYRLAFSFSTSIPEELREAAKIDGCTNVSYLFRIAIHLAGPIMAVLTVFYGVSRWNDYFQALIYVTDRELFPLQLFLREILIINQMTSAQQNVATDSTMTEMLLAAESVKYAVIVVASLPVMVIYPFVQRYMLSGITVGAVKG